MSTDYEGPTEVGHFKLPGRGTCYSMDFAGHRVEVYITEKLKKVRIHVDGDEWVKK